MIFDLCIQHAHFLLMSNHTLTPTTGSPCIGLAWYVALHQLLLRVVMVIYRHAYYTRLQVHALSVHGSLHINNIVAAKSISSMFMVA